MSKKYLLFFSCFLLCFLLFPSVKAASSYTVKMVSGSSNNKVIGSYSSYSEAVSVMNKQNSSSTSVASIYKDNKIINSRYAIFRFNPSNNTINLFQNAGDSTAYTYTNPSSMTDTAFINSNGSRVNVMLNGFNGWVDINSGSVIPISLLSSNMVSITVSGLNFRQGPSTSSKSIGAITCTNGLFSYSEKVVSGGYTWYKINYNGTTGYVASGTWLKEVTGNSLNTYYYRYSTGNLLHRFAYHNGSSYTDNFTNLGPTPSYLNEGVHYYSFDGGIYLYSSLTSMLDDYRENNYTRSINANNPNYSYYLFLPSKSVSRITAEQLNSQITNTNSKLYKTGSYFKEAERLYGMNALSAFATAKNESASGTSKIALDKNNVFGYGASDSCPYNCAVSYSSVRDSIMDYAKNGLSSYMMAGAVYYFGTNSGTKGSGRNVKYASDPLWGEKQASNAFLTDHSANLRDYKANTIGVTKYGKYNVPVYKDSNGSAVIYYLRNQNSNFKVYNVAVTVLGREGDYYKIYADSKSYQYGYIKIGDLNLTNSEPVINASDKEVKINSSFDFMKDVSASDKEDGNITNKVTYDGKVDTSKAGVYKVTYKVTDSSNFTSNKTVNITVKGESVPTIDVNNKEISAFTSFDYLDGVKAYDDTDGDITKNITYTGSVDVDKVGEYSITYSVVNSLGKSVSKTIVVKVIPNEKPVIDVKDKTIYLNSTFDELSGVKATDKEDGDISSLVKVVKSDVKTDELGKYSVTYSVTDKAGQETQKTITVTVVEKKLEKRSGRFDLEYLKYIDGSLNILGYSTIDGFDNTLASNINYVVKFVDLDDGDEFEQPLARITSKDEIPYQVPSLDGKDYTYSWFNGKIDFSLIAEGNYKMYIVATGDDYYSETLVNNQLFSEQFASAKDKSGKYVLARNDYLSKGKPLEILVRNDKIADKTVDGSLNQYGQFEELAFDKDGLLHLYGNSFSYGANMGTSTSVDRNIIFENVNNFDKYSFKLGCISKGLYDVKMPVSDGFSKAKAWYDNKIDVSKLPKGKYAIYINTISNVSDVSELDNQMFDDISNVSYSVNGKKYSFDTNYDQRYRVELTVK